MEDASTNESVAGSYASALVLASLVGCVWTSFTLVLKYSEMSEGPTVPLVFALLQWPPLLVVALPAAIALALYATHRIDRTSQRPVYVYLGLAGAVTGVLGILCTSQLVLASVHRIFPAVHPSAVSEATFRHLANAMEDYAYDHDGHYPPAEKWCDILVQGGYVDDSRLLKRLAKKRRWPYAINPQCTSESPGDIVLLFEARPGWNQAGHQVLVAVNHHREQGCYIIRRDGDVRFVRAFGRLRFADPSTKPDPSRRPQSSPRG